MGLKFSVKIFNLDFISKGLSRAMDTNTLQLELGKLEILMGASNWVQIFEYEN